MNEEISFGNWLRQQRRALDLSQQAFAGQVGCAEVTLRRIEKGTLKPSKELTTILLDKLGVPKTDQPEWISFARGVSNFPLTSNLQAKRPIINLPASLTSFIGREKEQSDVGRLITRHRLVTLTGPGGIGKTRLAMKVGENIAENYQNGVWLVELASITEPSIVPITTALTLGLRINPQRDTIDMLCNYLHGKRMLLILDNCEQILDGCAAFIFALLSRCPQLHVLATSREQLGVTGEALYRIPSLAVPGKKQTPFSLRDIESVQLFEERAQLIQFDFTFTTENAASIAQICKRLDGIPLAIELAAANIGRFSPEKIAEQLSENFHLLTTESRTTSPRHQTLHASIDWSWGLLSESEQRIMQQLSVFIGGWTLEAAQSVCAGDVSYLIGSLVTKSLIVMHQRKGTNVRYSFHEAILQYARERLDEAGETAVMRDKHRDMMLAFVEKVEPEILRADQKKWIDAMEDEHDNIRAALSWSIGNQNAELALRFCSALSIFWERHKHYHEAAQACKEALACAQHNENVKTTALYAFVLGSSAFYIALTESIPLSDPSIRIPVEQARKIYDAVDNYKSTGSALMSHMLTYVYMSSNDLAAAESCVSTWYEKVTASGFQWGIALANRTRADLSMAKNQSDNALKLWQESYDMFMEIGDVWAAMEVSRFLIWRKVLRGEFEDGIKLSKQNLLFYEEYGDPGGVASAYIYLGTIAREKGQYESARRYFTDSITVHTEIGNKGWSIDAGEHVAYLDYLEGNMKAARAKYESVFTDIKDIPDTSTHGGYYFRFAQICIKENLLAEAREALAIGLEIVQTNNQKDNIHAAYYGLGELARLEGNYSEAIENYRIGLKTVHDVSLNTEFPWILDGIAKTEYLGSKFNKSLRLFGAAEALRQKMGMIIHTVDQPEYDKYINLLKNRTSAAEFESNRKEGEKMDLEDVYQYAMLDGG